MSVHTWLWHYPCEKLALIEHKETDNTVIDFSEQNVLSQLLLFSIECLVACQKHCAANLAESVKELRLLNSRFFLKKHNSNKYSFQ